MPRVADPDEGESFENTAIYSDDAGTVLVGEASERFRGCMLYFQGARDDLPGWKASKGEAFEIGSNRFVLGADGLLDDTISVFRPEAGGEMRVIVMDRTASKSDEASCGAIAIEIHEMGWPR